MPPKRKTTCKVDTKQDAVIEVPAAKPKSIKKRKRRYSLCVEGLDLQTTQQLIGAGSSLPQAPVLEDQASFTEESEIASRTEELVGSRSRNRRFSVCFEGLEMQDMEKLLQEHRENAQVDDQLEVSLDGFDEVDELSMFLNTPTSKAQNSAGLPLPEMAASGMLPAQSKRSRRFSMTLDEAFISQIRASATAVEELPAAMAHTASATPIVRVMVPAREPPLVRMAVVAPGSLPIGMVPAVPVANHSVLFARKMPRAAPKLITAMPVGGGPAVVAQPVPKPMREISTQPVGMPQHHHPVHHNAGRSHTVQATVIHSAAPTMREISTAPPRR